MSSDLVSVVIPTYYRNNHLSKAIESVRNQEYDNIEIIVVDDSGAHHARSTVSLFENVQYIPLSENKGSNAARNIGFNQSSGRYINFLDDDDRLYEQKIKRQVECMNQGNYTGVVYCGIESDSGSDSPDPDARGDVLRTALRFNLWPCMTSTMLIDRNILSQVTPLENRPGGDDLGLMIALAERTQFDFVNEPLLFKNKEVGSRGSSMGAAMGRKQIIAEYSELYDRYPDQVRNHALAEAYHTEASVLLRNNVWSAGAIVAFAKQGYYTGFPLKSFVRIGASLFGSPGWKVAKWISNKV